MPRRAFEVTSLQVAGVAVSSREFESGVFLIGSGLNVSPKKPTRFGQVGGDDSGEWKQALGHLGEGILKKKRSSRRSDHDRIDDKRKVDPSEKVVNDFDVFLGVKHPRLDGGNGVALQEKANLVFENGRRNGVHLTDFERSFRNDTSDSGETVKAKARKGFEIGLDTGTGRAIRSGNGENDGSHGSH
jgi:hypothetical protein